MQLSKRAAAFGVLALACVVATVAYALVGRANAGGSGREIVTADANALAAVTSRPHVAFRHTALDDGYGRVAVVPLDNPGAERLFTPLSCERVYSAGGMGICLAAQRGIVTKYRADLLDDAFGTRHTLPLGGMPSRARVAADAQRAALTFFVSGDSYASGGFSTRTQIIDAAQPQSVKDLEEFAVSRNGAPFKAVDFNFWGVTFARAPNRFYATLASGGKMFLVEGDAAAKTARVVHDDVECPSLSPDNQRLAFKRRMPGVRLLWRIHVLNLATGQETAVAESRSVDDQVEWLDDETLLYALPKGVQKAVASMDVWSVRADGSGEPRLFLADAESPAVVREPAPGR